MLETLFASIGVMFTPMLTDRITLPGGLVLSSILGYLLTLAIIIGVTVVTNVVRALRWCRDKKDNFKSFGIVYGIKKGLLCGLVAVLASIAISYAPILRAPFTIISYIPGMGSMVDGFALAFFYLLSYMAIAYPIWGSC